MTVKQKQCLLYYLGYYVGNIDGDWGQLSKTATKMFQKDHGLKDDGVFGDATAKAVLAAVAKNEVKKPTVSKAGGFWDNIEFFTREEFRCQCKGKYCDGFPVEPEESMVRAVNEIRRRLGVPVQIVDAGGSGVRCKTHNANVGGVADSQHLFGLAADLHSSASPAKMAAVAEDVLGNTGGIGIYSWGIHVDTRKTKSRWNG